MQTAAGTKRRAMDGTKPPPGPLHGVLLLLSTDIVSQSYRQKYHPEAQNRITLPTQLTQQALCYLHISQSNFSLFLLFGNWYEFLVCDNISKEEAEGYLEFWSEAAKKQGEEEAAAAESRGKPGVVCISVWWGSGCRFAVRNWKLSSSFLCVLWGFGAFKLTCVNTPRFRRWGLSICASFQILVIFGGMQALVGAI